MDMDQWARVRRKLLVDGQSKRSVMSEEGLHWESLQKMLSHSRPPGYRRLTQRARKIDGYMEWIRQLMDADHEVPRKQRHTAKRIFDRLKTERGYRGGYTAVKEVVAVLKVMKREVFVPLSHQSGRLVSFERWPLVDSVQGHAITAPGGVPQRLGQLSFSHVRQE